MEKILLTEVIDMCSKFINKEIDIEELEKWGEKIEIKTYLPIVDKMAILYDFLLLKSSKFSGIEAQLAEIEVQKFWKILLKYTNIEIDDETLCTFDNYDKCYMVLGDYIVQFCYIDYDRICKMISESWFLNSIKVLADYLENLDIDSLKENNEKTSEFLKELIQNEKLVEDLKDIAIFNNPNTTKIIKELATQAKNKQKNKK